mmetsp:Transcript_60304/g.191571  ORF Transcript_60304/g.191571 Transcript_60304/m.191571 type:complete len:279 (+) Transcript_60304:399-1235(+)
MSVITSTAGRRWKESVLVAATSFLCLEFSTRYPSMASGFAMASSASSTLWMPSEDMASCSSMNGSTVALGRIPLDFTMLLVCPPNTSDSGVTTFCSSGACVRVTADLFFLPTFSHSSSPPGGGAASSTPPALASSPPSPVSASRPQACSARSSSFMRSSVNRRNSCASSWRRCSIGARFAPAPLAGPATTRGLKTSSTSANIAGVRWCPSGVESTPSHAPLGASACLPPPPRLPPACAAAPSADTSTGGNSLANAAKAASMERPSGSALHLPSPTAMR